MSQENNSLQQRVEGEFINSSTSGESMLRLVKEPSNAVVRRLISKFVGLLVSIMDRMLELLGIGLTEPDKLYENIDKAAERAQLLTMIMLKVLEDPEVRENIRQLAIALNDSALKPFLAVALITLKEMEPAIDEAEVELIERFKEGIRRAGDGAWDAFENVIAGVPGIGNTWSAFSALTSVIQTGQTVVQTSLQLILETTYRILGLLRKTSVPGLEAVDSFIDFGINAYNIYTNVTNKFDEINATMQQLKFTPKEGLNKQKLVEGMKEQSDAAQAMMPEGINAGMPEAQPAAQPVAEPTTQPAAESTTQPAEEPTTQPAEEPTTQPAEEPTTQAEGQPTTQAEAQPTTQAAKKKNTRTSKKRGGSRKKYKKRGKRRTKKRALKKNH